MSWQTEDGRHEGWAPAEFPDGRFSVGSTAGGAMVQAIAPGQEASGGIWPPDVADGRTAIGWRGLCTCGWRGPLWRRVPAARYDPAAHLVHADPGKWGDAPEDVEDAIYQEWRGHLPPPALADVRAAAQDAHDAQARLNDAVARARAAGTSWADVGDAAGITGQSARQRWESR